MLSDKSHSLIEMLGHVCFIGCRPCDLRECKVCGLFLIKKFYFNPPMDRFYGAQLVWSQCRVIFLKQWQEASRRCLYTCQSLPIHLLENKIIRSYISTIVHTCQSSAMNCIFATHKHSWNFEYKGVNNI